MSTFTTLDNYVSLKRAITRLRYQESKDSDFGANQISVLYKLSLANATMSELVEHTSSDKASMTRTISALVKMGFVRRKSSDTDRRVVYIELTPKGRKQAEKAHEIRNAIGKKLESTLNAEERKQFNSLIEKIISNLSR